MRIAPLALTAAALLATLSLATLSLAAEPEKKEPEKKKWDVNAPPGEASTATLDTRTGTWMSVDVSPDGKTLVFDLLGDLYTLPIEGGEAKALTHGIAWEMQPRFSPGRQAHRVRQRRRRRRQRLGDERRRHGRPRGVERRLPPRSTTPSGTRRATTSRRASTTAARAASARARSGSTTRAAGKGVALNEKPNWQKDLGEPAFSPDGRYVYFSQDTTPGRTFEYNKNSHEQIYVIQRLDTTDGTIEPFVTGPGGAVRPVPSPDGKRLAFVRRV